MLKVLLDYGDSRLNIDRGDDQPAACKQLKANGNFWGPWLP
eukprot:gene51638-51061_t